MPFDGLVVYLRDENGELDISSHVANNNAVSYQTVSSVLAPIKDLKFNALKQNFALVVMSDNPPDFFDDWSTIIQNFVNVAQAAKDNGLKGIILDNEDYGNPYWATYPKNRKYPEKSLSAYKVQARLRGAELMSAVSAAVPDIVFIPLIGPYNSEPKGWQLLFGEDYVPGIDELDGPFFVGLMEGKSAKSTIVDGGELYGLRTPEQFEKIYNWRKYTIASPEVDCHYIPLAFRSAWPNQLSVGFGMYDNSFNDASEVAATVTNALKRADKYAWFYTETIPFIQPPTSTTMPWINAVKKGKDDFSAGK